jgi:DNA-binding XRE family transcriptional regulator
MIASFNAARRARGLPVLAVSGRLDAATAAELRRWRCFEAGLTQAAAADLAGVTVGRWRAAERGKRVPADALTLVISLWNNGEKRLA